MDDPSIDPAEHRRALAGLARINRFSGSAGHLWPCIRKLALEVAPRPLRILDVATGSGDVLLGLWKRAQQAGVALELAGCDISDVAVTTALNEARQWNANIHYFEHDALHGSLPAGFDVITSSLFLHHLDESDLTRLLKEMARAATRAVLINDLSRSRLNFLLVWTASRLLTRSRVVHEDGPLSVRAALTAAELRTLAEVAGLKGATVTNRFPCRLMLEWRKPK